MGDRPGFPRNSAVHGASAPARIEVQLARLGADPLVAETAVLPEADTRRAASIPCPRQRSRFLAARCLLRRLLASRLGCPPKALSIVQAGGGKPRLAEGGIEFSLSRRGHWCAVALSADCPVGVDLEPIVPFPGMEDVAARFFPPQARAALAAAAPEQRPAVFFIWWTRIEAAVKAAGCGLDDAASCLRQVSHLYCGNAQGLALAVAAQSSAPLVVAWRAPQNSRLIQATQAGPASCLNRVPEASPT
jgi:4'-phosphopantetheinyl transferase